MQTAEIKPEEKKNNSSITIDAEKIKNIMAKIQIKPPEWANSYYFFFILFINCTTIFLFVRPDVWKLKLTQMCKDLSN